MTRPGATSLRLPRGRAYDPWAHAEALGLQVIERRIRTANELWMPDYFTIVIRSGLRAVHKRTALAHGVGHAALGHADDRPKHEHLADRFASLYLIDPNEYVSVAKWAEGDAGLICQELGVTHRLLVAYQQKAG